MLIFFSCFFRLWSRGTGVIILQFFSSAGYLCFLYLFVACVYLCISLCIEEWASGIWYLLHFFPPLGYGMSYFVYVLPIYSLFSLACEIITVKISSRFAS